MASLRGEGEVLYEDISSYEVAMQVIDLEARLENLRASEAAFLELLDRAESVADVVAVQSELSRIQGDIESYEAQLSGVKDQIEMASINVSLSLPVSPVAEASGDFDLGYEISSAPRKFDQRGASGDRCRDQHRCDRCSDRTTRRTLRFTDRPSLQRTCIPSEAHTRRSTKECTPRSTALIELC